jgi:hypothetical protein
MPDSTVSAYGVAGLLIPIAAGLALLAFAWSGKPVRAANVPPAAWVRFRFGYPVPALIFLAFNVEMILSNRRGGACRSRHAGLSQHAGIHRTSFRRNCLCLGQGEPAAGMAEKSLVVAVAMPLAAWLSAMLALVQAGSLLMMFAGFRQPRGKRGFTNRLLPCWRVRHVNGPDSGLARCCKYSGRDNAEFSQALSIDR